MTAQELIAELQTLPPEETIFLEFDDDGALRTTSQITVELRTGGDKYYELPGVYICDK